MPNRLGVCEWSLPAGGPTAVMLAAKMGFEGLQIGDLGGATMGYPMNSPVIQEAYLQAAEEYGVTLQCLHPYALQREGGMLFPMDTSQGERGKKDVEMSILACEKLGIDNVMLSSFFATYVRNEWDFATFGSQMRHACEFGADHGVRVTYESVLRPERILRMLDLCGDNLRLCYDVINPLRHGTGEPLEELKILMPYVDHFHVKDMPADMKGYAMIGEGSGHVRETAETICGAGYDGWLISENYYSTLSWETGTGFIELGRRDVETLRRLFPQRPSEGVS